MYFRKYFFRPPAAFHGPSSAVQHKSHRAPCSIGFLIGAIDVASRLNLMNRPLRNPQKGESFDIFTVDGTGFAIFFLKMEFPRPYGFRVMDWMSHNWSWAFDR